MDGGTAGNQAVTTYRMPRGRVSDMSRISRPQMWSVKRNALGWNSHHIDSILNTGGSGKGFFRVRQSGRMKLGAYSSSQLEMSREGIAGRSRWAKMYLTISRMFATEREVGSGSCKTRSGEAAGCSRPQYASVTCTPMG